MLTRTPTPDPSGLCVDLGIGGGQLRVVAPWPEQHNNRRSSSSGCSTSSRSNQKQQNYHTRQEPERVQTGEAEAEAGY